MEECEPLTDIFGESFAWPYQAIKQAEYNTFMKVMPSSEREYLLFNV